MRRRRKYSAANGSERRDGQQAVMAKRVAQATHEPQHYPRMMARTRSEQTVYFEHALISCQTACREGQGGPQVKTTNKKTL